MAILIDRRMAISFDIPLQLLHRCAGVTEGLGHFDRDSVAYLHGAGWGALGGVSSEVLRSVRTSRATRVRRHSSAHVMRWGRGGTVRSAYS